MDPKKTATTSAIALASALAGFGLHAQVSPPLPTSARPAQIVIAPDGKLAVLVENKIGTARDRHVLNFFADGSAAVLDSQPTSDPNVKAVGAALASPTCLPAIVTAVNALGDGLAKPQASLSK